MKLGLESLRIERGRQAYGQTPGIAAEKTQGADAFSTALEKLESAAKDGDSAAEGLVTGRAELHEALVRMEKADLMLKLGATVRTKVLDAYNKILTSAGS